MKKNYQILDATKLKLIAAITMVIDHIGDLFFADAVWMRMIGRIAMPVFAFCVSEGYIRTRNKKKYLLRMGISGLIAELPFDLAFFGKLSFHHQNIMLTFFLSILSLMIFERIRGKKDPKTKKYSIAITILAMPAVLIIAFIALCMKTDYSLFAVTAVFLFYLFADKPHILRILIGVGFLSITRTKGFYCATGLSFIPLSLYNGKRGRGFKWFFYVFYPGHLLLLYLIRIMLIRH